MQRTRLLRSQALAAPQRMNARAIEGFVSIDVPESSHHSLIQQHLLDASTPPAQRFLQPLNTKLLTQWLDANTLQRFALLLSRPQFDPPKFSRIGIEQLSAIAQAETHTAIAQFMSIRILVAIMMEKWSLSIPGSWIALSQTAIDLPASRQEQQIARHTPVDREDESPTQIEQQPFAAPPDLLDAPISYPGAKVRQRWMADCALPEDVSLLYGRTYTMGAQLARRILNFR